MTSTILLGLALPFAARRIAVIPLRFAVAVRTGVCVGIAVAVRVRAALGGTAAVGRFLGRHHLLELPDRDLPGHYLPQELERVVSLHHFRQVLVIQRGSFVTLDMRLLRQVMYEELLQSVS